MASIQIRRSRCKSASVYVAAGAGSGAGVAFGAESGPGELEGGPRESGTGSGELRIAVSGALADPFPFAVAPLGMESSSGPLGMAEPLWGFLRQVAILERSGAEKKLWAFPNGLVVPLGAELLKL